ncbi:hypothetical protein A3B42_01930 [Candidatus Daviesbacteria bacterium RIFCSPLOWO2_01_FULL_38_10]|nr:MAG: hypothetical protein A3D02_00200 [Candidatus Daviesbacteria bacterium RIFCSPHIGHO2_02_FULL_39_41]OGE29781.1 MAG: hypothetical protein A2772_00580 [Candidatus Daviesbacteria bacterium RIFCSPHIGHO2_01_FULL_38_8b]OGE40176.1 MAG: hypothetical protein A3B42_01930 [Candidatus Daviesbacteria bacterium RIFCSPLOWO2_01_FULL_38_10]OGE45476.1 MAG: hypothetical protein A3E67_03820 [Candidatus Daviesbacteria bacterium RIFCSPHIGHO2_12_FULL_38_25]OGE67562.1 MAG: hypothetical protein A3H81_00965 [Candid
MTTEALVGIDNARRSLVDKISPFQQKVGEAWNKLGGPDGSRVNIREIRRVLRVELAYHRAVRKESGQPPTATETLLARAARFNSLEGQSAALDFFEQAHDTKMKMLAGTMAAGTGDTVVDRQLTASGCAMNHLSGLMASTRV